MVLSNNSTDCATIYHQNQWLQFIMLGIYSLILFVGLLGNMLVAYIIVRDRDMRSNVTNLFILNLAAADFWLLMIAVEEIMRDAFHEDHWALGMSACKVLRGSMIVCLYVSVLTLTAVCVERYVAIVYPMKAHLWCSRHHTLYVIAAVWSVATLCSTPTLLFQQVLEISMPSLSTNTTCSSNPSTQIQIVPPTMNKTICVLAFSEDRASHQRINKIFKNAEFIIFFIVPLLTQIVLYSKISRTLFGRRPGESNQSHHHQYCSNNYLTVNNLAQTQPLTKQAVDRTTQSRKQVVKMLIACVVVYFTCYLPAVVPVIFDTYTEKGFPRGPVYKKIVFLLLYCNSAANPILYTVFSCKFRKHFQQVFRKLITCFYACCTCVHSTQNEERGETAAIEWELKSYETGNMSTMRMSSIISLQRK